MSNIFSLHLMVLVLLFTSVALSAQTYERSFGLEIAPHSGGNRITSSGGTLITALEVQDSIESGLGGYGIGLLYESRADKVGFTTGIRYLRTGYEVVENDLDGPTVGLDTRDEVTAQYLELPFEFNFHQDMSEKSSVHFMLGVAANLHLSTKTERSTRLDGVEQGTTELPDDPEREFRPVVASLNTGLGYDRKLGENWAIRVQPYFRFFLQGNLKTNFDQLNRNYYQTGVRVAIRRVFL
ncbi:outer membrane beta-barrel protein [Neolewinella aurantiaca]|uniref:Outer membrane beta-barrel protein n=1 Tax=Neolewinella aurantiaca TaxID=2602767 RepID=A0A5C7FU28_9BACT|nr:outer membrane beta-barrel protein [Neolewinella aurantiaca]TXF90052.1 outer membrane beta-barrel protein [Neolewinella aurantiaca]